MATAATSDPAAPGGADQDHDSRFPPQYRAAAVVLGLSLLLGAAFALSYTLALGRPAPHDVPLAVVGSPAVGARVTGALQAGAEQGLDLRPYPSFAAARTAVDEQRVYAVVDGADPPVLYVSSATGSSVARMLTELVRVLPPDLGVRVVDLHPLPRSDPQGLTAFYVTIAATILGFVPVFQLRANAGGLGLRPWLVLMAVLAVATGGVLAVVVGPWLGALQQGFGEVWLALSLQTAIAALFNSAMLVLIGRWAILPTWVLFIVLGNAASGGAVAPPLLPSFFAVASRVLPTGSAVRALQEAVYFRGHQHPEPFLVLAGWLVAVLVLLLVGARLRGRSPAQ